MHTSHSGLHCLQILYWRQQKFPWNYLKMAFGILAVHVRAEGKCLHTPPCLPLTIYLFLLSLPVQVLSTFCSVSVSNSSLCNMKTFNCIKVWWKICSNCKAKILLLSFQDFEIKFFALRILVALVSGNESSHLPSPVASPNSQGYVGMVEGISTHISYQ